MNLLLFVLALLLVFSSISYHAFERYLADSLLRNQWDHFMRVESRCAYNKRVEEAFLEQAKTVETHEAQENSAKAEATSQPKEEIQTNPKAKYEGASGIYMNYIINLDFANQNPEQTELMIQLLSRLIHFLYGKQYFFQQILQERPNAIQEMVDAVRKLNADRDPPIKKLNDISKLQLSDPPLRLLWYQLLRLNPVDLSVLEVLLQKPATEIDLKNSCMEVSLFNYITQNSSNKLRVYLIPRGLLYAIVQDREAVKAIIEKKKELHRQKVDAAEKMQVFQSFCMQFAGMQEFESILDFTVTSTSPNYGNELE